MIKKEALQVEIKLIRDEVFGNCVYMTNGLAEATVTVDFGPRVIAFSRAGMENMFYQDTSMSPLGERYDVFGGDQFKLYGGHRIWISPEIVPRCYHPDNLPVEYQEVEGGVEFTAPVESGTLIQKSLTVTFVEGEASVELRNSIKNCGLWDIELAPWCITMMAAGSRAVCPMPKRKTGLLHNRSLSLWDYSDMSDKRVGWGREHLTLRQDPEITLPFKVGYNNEDGWAACFNKGQVFIKRFEPAVNGNYPDNGCCYETYTNGAFLEMEALGQLEVLKSGESAVHVERWDVLTAEAPGDSEDEIRETMAKYI